jgi:hypothetical protein
VERVDLVEHVAQHGVDSWVVVLVDQVDRAPGLVRHLVERPAQRDDRCVGWRLCCAGQVGEPQLRQHLDRRDRRFAGGALVAA